MADRPECVDCIAEGVTRYRPTTGIRVKRCATHRRVKKKDASVSRWEAYILKTYNYTPEMYWALYKAQGGTCGVCQRATGKAKRLALDHDHACCPGSTSCGRCVRGLLCGPCNRLLGFARDAIEFFQRAIEYLTNPPAQRAKIWRRKK